MNSEQLESVARTVRRIRHDANNPLTVALGHVQLLLEQPERLDDAAIDSLRIVAAELDRLTAILGRLESVRHALAHADSPGDGAA